MHLEIQQFLSFHILQRELLHPMQYPEQIPKYDFKKTIQYDTLFFMC